MTKTYVRFVDAGSTGKTGRWIVESLSRGDVLGTVRWFGRWRQYAFYPNGNTIYSAGCLDDIMEFIVQQMAARRA